jgi:hypothetical protein
MAYNHGNEYQIRIVREDTTEELSAWMNSAEQVAQALILTHKPRGATCWLLVRNISFANGECREQILEYLISDMPSARYIPHDSSYLQTAESKNRYELGFVASRHTS